MHESLYLCLDITTGDNLTTVDLVDHIQKQSVGQKRLVGYRTSTHTPYRGGNNQQ